MENNPVPISSSHELGSSRGFDLEEPIRGASRKHCLLYWTDFDNAASQAEAVGEVEKAGSFKLLSTVCSFQPQFWNRAEPYEKIRISPDLAKVSVEHLPEEWLAEIKKIGGEIQDSALKARLLDIHWLSTKDHTSCRDAVYAYIEGGKFLDQTEDWYFGTFHFHRACQLGNSLGPNNRPAADARKAVADALKEDPGDLDEKYSRISWLLKIVWECGMGDEGKFAELAEEYAEESYTSGNLFDARRIWETAAQFWHAAEKPEASKAIKIRSAKTLVEEARSRSVPGDFLGASKVMEQAILALRQAGEESEKVKEIQKELREIQPKAVAEMKSVGFSTDITAEVLAIRDGRFQNSSE